MAINTVVDRVPVVLLTAWLTAAAAAPASAAVVPAHACQTAIEISSTVDLRWTAQQMDQFRHEAERVWTALGVDVCWRDARTPCDQARVTLHVRVAAEAPAGEPSGHRALGWIGFSDTAGPGPFIVLSVQRARELLGRAERAARRLQELPGLVERLLPRALGRALAHELGHYLLARRAHSAAGLMREAFRPEDLADDRAGQRTQLIGADAQALALRCPPRR